MSELESASQARNSQRLCWQTPNARFALLLLSTLVLDMLPSAAGERGNVMLWNRLGSEQEVSHSEIGPDGMIVGTQHAFEPAQFGAGYVRKAGGENYVKFPAGILHGLRERGTVSLWIVPKVPEPVPYQYGMFALIGQSQTGPRAPHGRGNVYLDWGDGVTGQGFFGGVQFDDVFAQTPDEPTQFIAAVGTPIHAAICWDIDGIDGGNETVRVYRDGQVVGTTTTAWNPNGAVLQDCFYLGVNPDSQGYNKWISDNIIVWDYAKTDFSDRFIESPLSWTPQLELLTVVPPTAGITVDVIEDLEVLDAHPNEIVFATQNVGAQCGGGTPASAWKLTLDPESGQVVNLVLKQSLSEIQCIRQTLFETSDGTLFSGGGWCGHKPPYVSFDGGETWQPASIGTHPPNSTFSFAEFQGEVYAGTGYDPWPAEIYRWLGPGGPNMWAYVLGVPRPRTVLSSLTVYQGRLFAGTGLIPCSGWQGSVPVYVSEDGQHYTPTIGIPSSCGVYGLAVANDTLIAIVQDCVESQYTVWRWDTEQESWQFVADYPLLYSYTPITWPFVGYEHALYITGRAQSDPEAGIYQSLDLGATWR